MIHRLRYRHGVPFITSVALAVVTTAWPLVRDARFHKGTSIWTFVILATISTAFALLYGGRFRTFFIAIAVTPPFLFFFWFLRLRFARWDYPIKPFGEYFLYFVVAPILLVSIVATVLNRKERHLAGHPSALRAVTSAPTLAVLLSALRRFPLTNSCRSPRGFSVQC